MGPIALISIIAMQHLVASLGQLMFFPWYALTMLALESSSVINRRLVKISLGGTQSFDEIQLMFSEKASATVEAATVLIGGGTASAMVARYREHVAANELRLAGPV
jgi:hypothetical protein